MTVVQSPIMTAFSGIFCLSVAIYLALNMYRTRRLHRSPYFIKFEFLFLAVLLLIALHHLGQSLEVRILWLQTVFDVLYTPILDILIAVGVLFINFHLNWKYKKNSPI